MEGLTRNTPKELYPEIQDQLYTTLKDKITTLESNDEKQFFLDEFIKYATN
jgi:hypothetical protein